MGDADVLAHINNLSDRLTAIFTHEFGLVWGFKDNILILKYRFRQIKAVLHDAEKKRSRENEVYLWLKSLRSASLMMENVLDDILIEVKLRRLDLRRRGIKHRVRAVFSFGYYHLIFPYRIARKVEAIRRNFDAIAFKISQLSLTHGVVSDDDEDVAGEMPDRETSSAIHDSALIFGRNEEVDIIIKEVCNKDLEDDKIRVCCIWGVRGVGKTTLAQSVYNHEMVDQCFDLKCWVNVNQNFQLREIIEGIIEYIDECECRYIIHLDVLQESLRKRLREKKFLVVLDDVSIQGDEKREWELLRETLSCGAKGSVVVMTTTQYDTMVTRELNFGYELGPLTPENAWLLFKMFALIAGGDDIEPIGMRVAKKAAKMPLALKSLGSLMWSKRSIRFWQQVNESNIWELEESSKVFPGLQLSYDELLPHLKQCFAYCSLFPKGHDIEKDVIIQLWVVNGFIPPKGEKELYVLGEDILNYLVWRSFLQVVKDRYRMPDHMHDLARHVMGDYYLSIERSDKKVVIPNEALHLSISWWSFYKFPSKDAGKSTSLRSIFMFKGIYNSRITENFNHMYLRVLYLRGVGLKTLPESICKLKHLKYLNLSHSSIQVLPESIIYLQNLQMLLLSFCYQLCKLPESLGYLWSLEVLDIKSCHSLMHLPSNIGLLTLLKRLPRFHVANNKSGAKIKELSHLNQLEGELEISGLENVGGLREAMSAKLKDKSNLSALKFSWSNMYMRERKTFENDEEVLEGLEPNSTSLKKLSIYLYMGKIISSNWMTKLSNLDELELSGCKRCESIPPLGGLPNLRVIKLLGMDSLEGFHSKDTDIMFLSLQELNIFMCPTLIFLPSNLPNLKILKLEECGALKSLPSLQGVIQLEIRGCKQLSETYSQLGQGWHQISHIPRITVDPPSWFRFDEEG